MSQNQIIVARSYGQLGNRLFLFGHMIAAAEHYGVELLNPCFADYANLFASTSNNLWCRYPHTSYETEDKNVPSLRSRKRLEAAIEKTARVLALTRIQNARLGVVRLKSSMACDLGSAEFESKLRSHRRLLTAGWLFRSETLFWKHADNVRRFFRPSKVHRQNIANSVIQSRSQCEIVIGVHIRRGDYATFKNGQHFYSDAHYLRWMHEAAEHFPGQKVGFLMCSNEPINHDNFAGLLTFDGPGNLVEDMYSLAEADFIIGPPSTFTGWSSFMGSVPLQFMQSKSDAVAPPTKRAA